MGRKHAWFGLGLMILAGCCYSPVRPEVDALICSSALRPMDQQPGATEVHSTGGLKPGGSPNGSPGRPDAQLDELLLTGAQEKKGQPTLQQRLQVPSDLGRGTISPIVMPDPRNKVEYEEAVKRYFPPLPDIGTEVQSVQGPNGTPLTLADLQQLAHANSPELRQAAADVENFRGAMIQAGLYPNPTFGVTGATDTQSGGPTYGPLFGQTITTMGKLKLARAAAHKDLENAQLSYRRAESDLMAKVRTGYFSVLVAQESIRQNRALVSLTDEVYKVLVQLLKGGEFATYEPMQVGTFAAQARVGLIQARNSYTLAWKQLSAAMGLPSMPPTLVAGTIRDLPLPVYRYDTALAHVLSNHTDVLTALNGIDKARYNLRLAEVTPVPDVNTQVGVFNDASQPGPNRVGANFSVTVASPVWNLNQGNVHQAKAALLKANEEPHRVRDDLTARTADAFRRYKENFDLLQLYHTEILPKQIQAYRSAVKRHDLLGEAGGVGYLDLVSAEQNLVGVIGTYLTVLQGQWQAVADLGSLLQTMDIFQLAEGRHFAEVPDLSHILELPCCHPCSSLPNDTFKGADLQWPEAGFGAKKSGGLGVPLPLDERPAVLPQVGKRS
jgi:outer membrane protein, heavy metal efflux system